MNNTIKIVIGFIVLLAGALVYLTDRPAESTLFVSHLAPSMSFYGKTAPLFGVSGHYLPAFAHVFSFSFMTAGLCNSGTTGYAVICLSWTGINVLFEAGQKFKEKAVAATPEWLDAVPVFRHTHNYFINGTFDYHDLIAYAAGGLLAYVWLMATSKQCMTAINSCDTGNNKRSWQHENLQEFFTDRT